MTRPIHVTLTDGQTLVMPAPRTESVQRISPRDWARMSWHQRQAYAHRRARATRPVDPDMTVGTDRRTIQQRRADDMENLLWMISVGCSPTEISDRLDANPRAIERRLHRKGHHAEAALFRAADWNECDCGKRKSATSRMCKTCAARLGGKTRTAA